MTIGVYMIEQQDVAGSTPAGVSTVAGSQMPEGEWGVDPAATRATAEVSRKSAHYSRPAPGGGVVSAEARQKLLDAAKRQWTARKESTHG